MDIVNVTITGKTPILVHADSIEWADTMEAWRAEPGNKSKSKAGDDRTPPYRWMGYLNFDDFHQGIVTIPSEYIMRSIMGGAALVPSGRGKGTMKAVSQSGLLCPDFHWPLFVRGKAVQMSDIQRVGKLPTYRDQAEAVKALGFTLFAKRARVGTSKHIRIRPRFDEWATSGQIHIIDDSISVKTLGVILELAGRLKGMGDWRPGSPTPGPFGMFRAEVKVVPSGEDAE